MPFREACKKEVTFNSTVVTKASTTPTPLEVVCEIKILGPHFNVPVDAICPDTDLHGKRLVKGMSKAFYGLQRGK